MRGTTIFLTVLTLLLWGAGIAPAAEPTVTWSEDGSQLTITAPLPAPVADSPEVETAVLVTDAETVAASVPTKRFGRALKRAALWLRICGRIDREARQQVVDFVNNPERAGPDGPVNLLEEVKVAAVEQMVEEGEAGMRVGFDFMELLQWIIDNWDTIYEIIQMIMDLFAQDLTLLPAEQYVVDSPGVPPPEYVMAA